MAADMTSLVGGDEAEAMMPEAPQDDESKKDEDDVTDEADLAEVMFKASSGGDSGGGGQDPGDIMKMSGMDDTQDGSPDLSSLSKIFDGAPTDAASIGEAAEAAETLAPLAVMAL